MTAGLPLIKRGLTPLDKSVLLPLGLSAGVSAADTSIQKKKKKKNHGSEITTLIISNEEMEDIMKIDKQPEESRLLIKGISEEIKNETKEQKGGIVSMLLGTLLASLLKEVIRVGENF